jgi:diaminopimelate decarboxylase
VRDLTGFETTVLNLGGGFGIQYLDSDPKIDLSSLLLTMIKTLEKYIKELDLKIQKVMLEPGRSIVGDAE